MVMTDRIAQIFRDAAEKAWGEPIPRTADFRSPPGIHPLSVQPKAQVSSLRKAAVPRAIEQMGRPR